MDAAAIDDQHDLLASVTTDMHDLMEIVAQLLGITMGHDLREATRRALLDSPENAEQDTAGEATPGAIRGPRLAFERFGPFDLRVTQWASREARALGAAPPAQPGEGKAPQAGCICVEHNACTPTRAVCKGGESDRAIGEVGRRGIEPSGGTTGADRVFFQRPRTLSRPRGTPVSRVKPGARARQLHGAGREPWSSGSGSTRRSRYFANAPVTLGGRPERGRSTRPGVPWWAKRWPHVRRAA
jgi:hypothetical protein